MLRMDDLKQILSKDHEWWKILKSDSRESSIVIICTLTSNADGGIECETAPAFLESRLMEIYEAIYIDCFGIVDNTHPNFSLRVLLEYC